MNLFVLPKLLVGVGVLVAAAILLLNTNLVKQNQVLNQVSNSSKVTTTAESVSLNLSPSSLTKKVNEKFDVEVSIKAGDLDISGADITIKFNPSVLELSSFTPSNKYNNVLLNGPVDNKTGSFRFIVANSTATPIKGEIVFGTLHFKAKAPGSSPVTFGTNQITASGHPQAIPTNSEDGKYEVKG